MSIDDKLRRYAADGKLDDVIKCLNNGANINATNNSDGWVI